MLRQKLRKLRICPQRVQQICATVIRLPRRVAPTPFNSLCNKTNYSRACISGSHTLQVEIPSAAWGGSVAQYCRTVAHDETWPHSSDARKYSWKHLKSEFIWLENCKKNPTIIIRELYLSFLAVTDIMRHLWNYRTDFHCSSCWQTLLSWGCGRTTDQSHMEYAEMLLCRNRRCFNSSCRIKSPGINTMLTEANRCLGAESQIL